MIDQVEAKLQELKKQQREEYYRRKNADLSAWGLVTRKGNKKHAPLVVTDEEYDALIAASNGVGMPTRNGYARVLNAVGVILLAAGIIIGFVLANFAEQMQYVWFIASVAVGIVLSILFFGLAEAIRLLQQVADMQRGDHAKKANEIFREFPEEQPDVTARFSQTQLEDAPPQPYQK